MTIILVLLVHAFIDSLGAILLSRGTAKSMTDTIITLLSIFQVHRPLLIRPPPPNNTRHSDLGHLMIWTLAKNLMTFQDMVKLQLLRLQPTYLRLAPTRCTLAVSLQATAFRDIQAVMSLLPSRTLDCSMVCPFT